MADKTNNLNTFLADLATAIKTNKGTSEDINAQDFADKINLEEKTVTASSTAQTITPSSTYYGLKKVTIEAINAGTIIGSQTISSNSSFKPTITKQTSTAVSGNITTTAPASTVPYIAIRSGSQTAKVIASTVSLDIEAGYIPAGSISYNQSTSVSLNQSDIHYVPINKGSIRTAITSQSNPAVTILGSADGSFTPAPVTTSHYVKLGATYTSGSVTAYASGYAEGYITTADSSSTISAIGVNLTGVDAKIYIPDGSATPSATVVGSSSTLSSTTAMNNQYFSVTPKASVGTAGWISSISDGAAVNYKVKDGSATGRYTLTELDSVSSTLTTINKQLFKIQGKGTVTTAGWISSVDNGVTNYYTVKAGSVTPTSQVVESSSALSGYTTLNNQYFKIVPKATITSAGWISSISDGTEIKYKVSDGSVTTPATTITANPVISATVTAGSGYKMSVSKAQSVTPSVSAGWVSTGTAGTVNVTGSAYVNQSTLSANSFNPSTSAQTLTISAGYYPTSRTVGINPMSYATLTAQVQPTALENYAETVPSTSADFAIAAEAGVSQAGYVNTSTSQNSGNSYYRLTRSSITKTDGNASAAIVNQPTASASITTDGVVTTTINTGYVITATATGYSGNSAATLTSSQITATSGWNEAAATISTTASNTISTATTKSANSKIYIQKAEYSATAVRDYNAKATITAHGFTAVTSGTTAYYVNLTTDLGSAKAVANVTKEGYVKAGSIESVGGVSINVQTGASIIYIPAGSATNAQSITGAQSFTPTVSATSDTNVVVPSPATTTKPGSGYYVAVKSASATAKTVASTVTLTKVKGMIEAGSVIGNTTTTVGLNESAVTYVPVQSASSTVTSGSASSGVITQPAVSVSTKATGVVTTTVNTGYVLEATASANSGVVAATLTASSAVVNPGYLGSTISITTSATNTKTTAASTATSSKTYIQKGALGVSGSATSAIARMTAGGFSVSSATTSYYMDLTGTSGSVAATASVSTEGYVKSETASTTTSVPVSISISRLYIPVATITAAVNSLSAPTVTISGSATGMAVSSTATSYYVTASGTGTNGSVKATASGNNTGMISTSTSHTSGASAITPNISGSGTKVYIKEAVLAAAVSDLSAPTVTINKSVTGMIVSSATTSYYITIGNSNTNGSVKSVAGVYSEGYAPSALSKESAASAITPNVSGATVIYIQSGAYSASVVDAAAPTVTISKSYTGMSPLASGTSSYYITIGQTTTNGSAKAKATVGTAGYIPTGSVTSSATGIGANVSGTGTIYFAAAGISYSGGSVSASNGTASATSSVSSSGIAAGVTTTATSYYVTAAATASATGGSATITSVSDTRTAGWLPARASTVIVSGTNKAGSSSSTNSSSTIYLKEAVVSHAGGALAEGTIYLDGALSGGGLTAGSGEVSITQNPKVTPSIGGTGVGSTAQSNYGVTTTKPSGTDGTNYITLDPGATVNQEGKAKGRGSVSRATINRATFAQYATRAAVTDTRTAGYLPARAATNVISAATISISLAAGFINSTSGTSNYSGESSTSTTVNDGTNYYIPVVAASASATNGSATANATINKAPTATASASQSGMTAGVTTTATSYYFTSSASAASGYSSASASATGGSATASVGKGVTSGASISKSGSSDSKSASSTEQTASDSSKIYLKAASATVAGGGLSKGTASGGGLSKGTASGGAISGGGLSAGNGSVSGSGVTLSDSNTSGVSVYGYGSVSRATISVSKFSQSVNRASFSQSVTRATITRTQTAGYLPDQAATAVINSASESVSLESGSITVENAAQTVNSTSLASSTATKYITAVSIPDGKVFDSITLASVTGTNKTTLNALVVNSDAQVVKVVNGGIIGGSTTTVANNTSANRGTIYIPHPTSGMGNVYVAPYTSGTTYTFYQIIENGALKTGSFKANNTSVTATPSLAITNSSGIVAATVSATATTSSAATGSGWIANGTSGTSGTATASGNNTLQLTTLGATTYNTSTSNQTISAYQWLTGAQTIRGVTTSGIDAANIKYGATITVGDSASAGRIKNVSGTFTSVVSSGQTKAAAGQLLTGYSAFVDGAEVKGSMASKGAVAATITSQDGTYTIPAGYHNGSGKVTAHLASASSGKSSGTASATVTAQPSVSVSAGASGVVTTTINTGYKVTASASANSGSAAATVTASSAWVGPGYLGSTVSVATSAANAKNTAASTSTSTTTYIQAGVLAATLSSNTSGSASMAATGMVTSSTATSYYVTLSTSAGSVNAKASMSTEGYVKGSSIASSGTLSVGVTGNGNKLYIQAGGASNGTVGMTSASSFTPTISKHSNTNALSSAATTTQPGSGYYVAVQSASVTAKTVAATVTLTKTAGYITAGSATNSNSTTVGLNTSSVTYVPLTGASSGSSSGTASAAVITNPTASTSATVTGMVTTTTNTGYAVSATASANSGVAAATVSASSAWVGPGYLGATVSVATSAKNAKNTAASTSSSTSTFIQKGVLSATASQVSSGSAAIAATGFTAVSSGTTSYYVTLTTSGGVAKAAAGVNTEGYVKSETAAGTVSIGVSGNNTKIYIPTSGITASVNSLAAPTVSISKSASGFTASSATTSYYVTVGQTTTNGSVKAYASGNTTGMVSTSTTHTSGASAIGVNIAGTGKLYIPTANLSVSLTANSYVANYLSVGTSSDSDFAFNAAHSNTVVGMLPTADNTTDNTYYFKINRGSASNGSMGISSAQSFTPSISKGSDTNVSVGTMTTTKPSSGYYVAVSSASVTAKTVAATITLTKTDGWISAGTAVSHNSTTVALNSSGNYYLPITSGGVSNAGGGLTQGTASGGGLSQSGNSGGGLSGGGLSAGSGSVSGSNVTLSDTNTSGISVSGSGSVTRATVTRAYFSNTVTRATFSQAVTRATVTINKTAGYIAAGSLTGINSGSSTVVLNSGSSTVALGAGYINSASQSSNSATKYITDITVPAGKTLNSVTLAGMTDSSVLSTLTLNKYSSVSNIILDDSNTQLGNSSTTVSSNSSNNKGTIYIPHKTSGSGNVYVAPYTSGTTYTFYKIIENGALVSGTITNNTSGGTSSGTINCGSQIKIGKGYYTADTYYTAQTSAAGASGNVTCNASSGNNVAGYATASVKSGSATTPADQITNSFNVGWRDDGQGWYITSGGTKSITPTVSAGWVSSGTAGTVTATGSTYFYGAKRNTSPLSWSKTSYTYIRVKAPTSIGIKATCIKGGSYYAAISLSGGSTSSSSSFRHPDSNDDTIITLVGAFTTSSTITFYSSNNYGSGSNYSLTYTPTVACKCIIFRFSYYSSTVDYVYAWEIPDNITQKTCLIEGTLITMADGSYKPIEDVRVGDMIKSYNPYKDEFTVAAVMENRCTTKKKIYDNVIFSNGIKISYAESHEIYSVDRKTYVTLDNELRMNEHVMDENGNIIKLCAVDNWIEDEEEKRFFDIFTTNMCYFANGILFAHNMADVSRNAKIYGLEKFVEKPLSENILRTELSNNKDYLNELVPIKSERADLCALIDIETDYLKDTKEQLDYWLEYGIPMSDEVKERRKLATDRLTDLWNQVHELDKKTNELKAKYSSVGEDINLGEFELRSKLFLKACKTANENSEILNKFFRNINNIN